MENKEYWSGNTIPSLKENEIFVFGSNPAGIHGAGAAKTAMAFGARYGTGRGLVGQTYALVTKNLKNGFFEKATGITYQKEGYCSVSSEQIRTNIDELYSCAMQHPEKRFLVTYQCETWPNGTPKKSLNGYTSHEILNLFSRETIPSNIVFHESYQVHLERHDNKGVSQKAAEREYHFFFHLTSPFSNFHPARFTFQNLTFISNEQFMMFAKAKTFQDAEMAGRILNIQNEFQQKPGIIMSESDQRCYQLIVNFKSGAVTTEMILGDRGNVEAWNAVHKKIKALGRGVKNYNDQVWSEKREHIVGVGAKEKFTQNATLKQSLLEVGDAHLVEASPYDKIWGIGLSAADAKKMDATRWPGLNLLGKILTRLRDGYREDLKNSKNRDVRSVP